MTHFRQPRRRHKNSGRRSDLPQLRFPGHLQFVRGFECLIADKHECGGRIEAAHCDGPIPNEDRGGKGRKDHDKWTLPLCSVAHQEYHNMGWQRFEQTYGVDTKRAAEDLARRSPHRRKWEQEDAA